MADTAALDMKDPGSVTIGVTLGLGPFVLIDVTVGEDDSTHTQVTTGGGVPQDPAELVAYLREVAEMIEESIT